MSFCNFFVCGQPYLLRDISQTFESKSTTETFSDSTWFIHFDGLCNYLHSNEKQPAANFFKNNCYFSDQDDVGHYINKLLKQGLTFSSNTFYVSFNADFATAKISRVIIVSSSGSSNSSSFSRRGGGSSSGSDSTSGCGSSSSKILTCTGE